MCSYFARVIIIGKGLSLLDLSWLFLSFPRKSCCDSRFLHLHQFLSGNFLVCSLIWTFTSCFSCSPPCFPRRVLQMPCSALHCITTSLKCHFSFLMELLQLYIYIYFVKFHILCFTFWCLDKTQPCINQVFSCFSLKLL